ncbi:hypothetical protein SAY87_025704 [Trapa incisa]|uniref:Uncharacterized protein n=1 Tax=Trapa incisa TaxID=236973 RepID=A0AAN7H1R1_9MYRT|nr:hypothetical protein SAY87_025704 [Trapa incisa]
MGPLETVFRFLPGKTVSQRCFSVEVGLLKSGAEYYMNHGLKLHAEVTIKMVGVGMELPNEAPTDEASCFLLQAKHARRGPSTEPDKNNCPQKRYQIPLGRCRGIHVGRYTRGRGDKFQVMKGECGSHHPSHLAPTDVSIFVA